MTGSVQDGLEHLCILASAGAGKTYQLTGRYLRLVAAGTPPSGILASTFTRLAAGEIRDRILLRLAEAVDDGKKRAELAASIGRDAIEPDEVIALLRTLTRQLHRLQVRTIDSFFAAVVQSFAGELGVAPGSRVVDEGEAAELRAEAIRRMLAGNDAPRLLALLRRLTQGAADRSVLGVIDRTVEPLYELRRDAPFEAWERVASGPTLDDAGLDRAIADVERVALPSGLESKRATDVERARGHDWEGLLASGLSAKIAAGATTFGRTEIPADAITAYDPLVAHAGNVLRNLLRAQTTATRDLLSLYDVQYERVRRERRAMTFNDLTVAVARAEGTDRLDELGVRLDATLGHLLLDEFQDTNFAQWRALVPLVRAIVAPAPARGATDRRSFFCVGDVKQSIYGWRGACPEILETLPARIAREGGTVAAETLSRTYRSAPAIVEAVNDVFASLPSNPALGDCAAAGDRWSGAFRRHDTAKEALVGRVELRTVARGADDDTKADRDRRRLGRAAALVADIHRKRPDLTIAVLTRTNKAVSRVLYELGRSDRRLPASGRGGGPLTDATPVNVILDLLRLADHPDDTVAAFHVARGPLGSALAFIDEADEPARHALARRTRRRLLADGYAATIDGWRALIEPACDEREALRLEQLVARAGRYDAEPSLRPSAFVKMVEIEPVPEARPAPIQVMTIHQSKGLEFDAVVLPELESSLVGRSPAVAVERDDETGAIRGIVRWGNTVTRSVLPELAELFKGEQERHARESLSLLYVAMTRAKRGLFMLIEPPTLSKKGTPSTNLPGTAAGVVRAALAGVGPPEPDTLLYETGDPDWLNPALEEAPAEPPAVGDPAIEIALPAVRVAASSGSGRRILAGAAASAHAGGGRGLREQLALGDDAARDRGLALHALFERIGWLEDGVPDDETALDVVAETVPRRDAAWRRDIVARFRAALAKPAVTDLLRRGDADPAPRRVWRERPFARVADDRLHGGRIDRLTADLDPTGRPLRGMVVDYKTDTVTAARATAQAETYRGQLTTYRTAAADLLRLPPEAVGMVVVFVWPGVVIDLTETGRPGDEGSFKALLWEE